MNVWMIIVLTRNHINMLELMMVVMQNILSRSYRLTRLRRVEMPLPGDNGAPALEKKKQENRITDVANKDACVQKEVILNKPAPKEKCIFGEI